MEEAGCGCSEARNQEAGSFVALSFRLPVISFLKNFSDVLKVNSTSEHLLNRRESTTVNMALYIRWQEQEFFAVWLIT